MIREQAKREIDNIDFYLQHHTDDYSERSHDAMMMAIQALSQEPCDDAVSIRKDVLKCRVGKLVVYNVEWLKKHWQMEMDIVCGVKPCDDAISREAVIKDFTQWRGKMAYSFGEDYSGVSVLDKAIRVIKGMPSVTPKSEDSKESEDNE